MTGTEPGRTRYAFGEFTLDVSRAVLVHGDREVRLRPKSFQVLRHLVEHAGVLVERRVLMDAVWGTTVVTEDSLTQCIIEVRRALGERGQHMVRTVPRRGFIFDVEVRVIDDRAASSPVAPAPADVAPPEPPARPSSRVATRIALLALVLAATVLGGWWFAVRDGSGTDANPTPGPTAASERSIAVLRFVDLSPTGDQSYFADGLAEEILHLLAQSPDLRVAARGSSFVFGAGHTDVAEVAARLGVRHVLEGSVRRDGDSLRVTVQLIDAEDGSHVWSRTYDRVLGRILELQSDIASEVAEALQVTLARVPYSTSPAAAEAQELYLLGLHLFHRRGPGDLVAAARHFEEAVQLDPQHARAWTALAGAYNVHAFDELRDPTHRLEAQRQALERALAIDPGLAEAHVRLARYFVAAGDRAAAEAAFARARAVGPNDPLVLATLSYREARDGRLEEAIELAQRLVDIDPLSALYRANLAHLLLAAGRYESALAELQRTQALSPRRDETGSDIAVALLLSGRPEDARQSLAGAPEGFAQDRLQVLLGSSADAQAASARLDADRSALGHFLRAEIAAYRGDSELAFREIEAALDAHGVAASRLDFDLPQEIILSPFLRPLHDDPRWATLRARLAPPWT
jgi:TolB-like protein/DNA-binding winged helix-turn-helix (wHTH) protein/Flp pilus assembly protein TadD